MDQTTKNKRSLNIRGRLFFYRQFIYLKKISNKWFTKYKLMDIITVVSKKFRRRSNKMMRFANIGACVYIGMTTSKLNNMHSTGLEWIA